jgi:hypothetical protein
VHLDEALGVPRRFESPHPSFPFIGRLVKFSPDCSCTGAAVSDTRYHGVFADGRRLAAPNSLGKKA